MLAPMSSSKRFWEEVHHHFDPNEPVSVEQAALHVAREPKYNVLATIERKMSATTSDYHRFLLTGAVGNGKSSELNVFTARLTRSLQMAEATALLMGRVSSS